MLLQLKVLLFALFAFHLPNLSSAYEIGDCVEQAPRNRSLGREVILNKGDWSWEKMTYSSQVMLKVYNSSASTIRAVEFQGTQTGKKFIVDHHIPAFGTEVFFFGVPREVLSTDTRASARFYEWGWMAGQCLKYYTEEDRTRDLIYNNCFVAKTKDGGLPAAARRACEIIADDPSFIDRLIYGR